MSDKQLNLTPWTAKYRPSKIDDLLLPQAYRDSFKGQPQNFLFYGTQGNGKTTAAKALANYYTDKHSQLFINASESSGIDTIRTRIMDFCSTVSLSGSGLKVVILDEIDYMSQQAQMAMRGTIEKFAGIAYFIATCNYPDRLAESLRDSRFKALSFDFSDEQAQEMQKLYMIRLYQILKENNISIEKDALIALINKRYPDMRAILNTCYFVYSQGKQVITYNDVATYSNSSQFAELYKFISECKNPVEHYKYLSKYKGRESDVLNALSTEFCEWCYEQCTLNPDFKCKLGDVVVIAHKYGVESKQSIDMFVTMLACCFELSKFVG